MICVVFGDRSRPYPDLPLAANRRHERHRLFPSGEIAGDSSAPAMSVNRFTVTTCLGMRLTRAA